MSLVCGGGWDSISGEVVVPGKGPINARGMIVGEAPGETEAAKLEPFVGRAGAEQARYLANEGESVYSFYRTNVVKTYIAGNPDPTPALIERWTPTLLREIGAVQPRFILAVGRFAVRWFLGDDVEMDAVHGIPHRSPRAPNAVVMPCFHPAYGFYDDEARTLISYDYSRAVAAMRDKISVEPPVDEFEGSETYLDVTGDELRQILDETVARYQRYIDIDIDTEGVPSNPWSVQVSLGPGLGLVLRCSQPDFPAGIAALQHYIDHGPQVTPGALTGLHNGMYDIEMCRVMGLDLFDANLFDTMYAAYITRIEPQALKSLAYRWTGMKMRSYDDTVGPIGLEKQLAYLGQILEHAWDKPEPRVEYSNDGTSRLYTPQPVERRSEAILVDYYSGKVDKGGNRVDPHKRWKQVDRAIRQTVEAKLGPMPVGTLADIPLDEAIYYAARDPDATGRTRRRLTCELERRGLTSLMADGMSVLPIFEQMQSSGMPANRRYFEKLSARMWSEMCKLQARISHRYYQDKPFNPASSDQVAALMRRRGLVGEKRSKKTGKMSTAKKSIEHLRYEDDAISDVIEWRERQKIKDAFCDPILDIIPEDTEIADVRCTIKTTRVATRRLSASNPPLLAIPVRHELGKEVRGGYQAPPGEAFGSWDLSQIEMRYMAHVSKDPLLIQFFNDPRLDVHCETAARIFGLKINEKADTKEERYANVNEMEHRYPSKRAGFGIITNIMGPGLLDQLRMFGCKGWDVDKCDDLIESWLDVYKGVRAYLGDCRQEVRTKGVVSDEWGMPRYLPGVWSSDKKVAAEAERAASSHKIQGGAQGMIQRSMAWLRPYIRAMQAAGLNVHWVLQIHDELILRFSEDLWETLDPLVREALTLHSKILIVPVKCSGSRAATWGKLK